MYGGVECIGVQPLSSEDLGVAVGGEMVVAEHLVRIDLKAQEPGR